MGLGQTLLAAEGPGGEALAELAATVQARQEMERREAMLVRRARNQGATWVQIAGALGVTKQAIHKKYATK